MKELYYNFDFSTLVSPKDGMEEEELFSFCKSIETKQKKTLFFLR